MIRRMCGWWLLGTRFRFWHGWVMLRVWLYGTPRIGRPPLGHILREFYFVVTGHYLSVDP